ncbi:MAG TPA: hypothetical protein VGG39_36395 [Polyangiaceae bacterium]|jgi:hypothetical protein
MRRIAGGTLVILFVAGCGGMAACGTSARGTSSGDASADGAGGVEGGDASPRDGAAGDAPSNDAGTGTDAGDASSPWSFAPTTSVAELTQNDTSACGSDAGPCTTAWTTTHTVTYGSGSSYAGTTRTVEAFWDHPVAAGAQNPGSAKGYVSKVPVGSLLPGAKVPVWIETQNWWGVGSGHITNGEVSSSAQQAASQVADHVSRGFAGQVVDWNGPGIQGDLALPTIRTSAEATKGAYGFAVMIDKEFFEVCGETVACLDQALSYIATTYGTSPAYLKDAGGHPIVFYFVNSYYPTEYALLQQSGVDAGGTSFVMYEPNGFPGNDPPNTIGEYAWVNPSDGTYVSTTGDAGTFATSPDLGFADLSSFFSAASAHASSFAVSEAHKGFDDNLANWSLDRVIDQRCGATWLQTFDHTGSFGGKSTYESTANYLDAGGRLDMVMVDTWDDYEEGTEIETGIDDCLQELDVTLAGSTLTWTPTYGTDPMDSTVTGTEATLDHYDVYLAKQGQTGLMLVSTVACTGSGGTCGHTLDVSTLGVTGGPYVFFVQAVGKPSIVNTLSGASTATYSAP